MGGQAEAAEGVGVTSEPALEQGAEVRLLWICESTLGCATLWCGLRKKGGSWVWRSGGLGVAEEGGALLLLLWLLGIGCAEEAATLRWLVLAWCLGAAEETVGLCGLVLGGVVAEEAGALLLLGLRLRCAASEETSARGWVLVLTGAAPTEETVALRLVLSANVAEEGGHLEGVVSFSRGG